ncbi:MAG: TetR/AcrR family transcriptional regulator [Candidatus Limnocylindrales bacterium]
MSETATVYKVRRSPRLSADERRQGIVAAGVDEFAAKGLAGASVDVIARRAGVSQPYVFQLFGTKKDLFIAVIRHGFERTRIAFEVAADRFDRGETTSTCGNALEAMGLAYMQLLADRTLLLVQLQAYAACSDPDVRDAVRESFDGLHRYVAGRAQASPEDIHHFFAEGMLLNVGAAVRLEGEPITWTLDKLGGAH